MTPEASTELLPGPPSKVTVELLGKVEELFTERLPAIVIVGLDPVDQVLLALLVKPPLKSIPVVIPVIEVVPLLVNSPFMVQAVMEFAVTVSLLVNVPPPPEVPKLTVSVPVPTVMVPLLTRFVTVKPPLLLVSSSVIVGLLPKGIVVPLAIVKVTAAPGPMELDLVMVA